MTGGSYSKNDGGSYLGTGVPRLRAFNIPTEGLEYDKIGHVFDRGRVLDQENDIGMITRCANWDEISFHGLSLWDIVAWAKKHHVRMIEDQARKFARKLMFDIRVGEYVKEAYYRIYKVSLDFDIPGACVLVMSDDFDDILRYWEGYLTVIDDVPGNPRKFEDFLWYLENHDLVWGVNYRKLSRFMERYGAYIPKNKKREKISWIRIEGTRASRDTALVLFNQNREAWKFDINERPGLGRFIDHILHIKRNESGVKIVYEFLLSPDVIWFAMDNRGVITSPSFRGRKYAGTSGRIDWVTWKQVPECLPKAVIRAFFPNAGKRLDDFESFLS